MEHTTLNSFILLIVVAFFTGCTSTSDPLPGNGKRTTYYPTGELFCQYQLDSTGVRSGWYRCHFENGGLKEKGEWFNDTTRINEQIMYYPNGQIKRYNFYDFLGYRRYTRSFSMWGELLEEKGDFLGYEEYSPEISVGDTFTLKLYVATPPGCRQDIFGIDSRGRYDAGFEQGEERYVKILTTLARKEGYFVFPYEADFIDSVNNIKTSGSGNVKVRVVDPQ